ncbi:MAG: NAD(P)H-dependent oxidoreductase, partial [Gammaproteobacteria bacterium]
VPRVFRGRPVALAGGSPGGFGTLLAQNAWLPVFRTLGVDFWAGGRLLVSRVATLVDADGNLTDEPTREAIRAFMAGFVAHVRRR